MVVRFSLFVAAVGGALAAGCVAPEEPRPAPVSRPIAAPASDSSSAKFEDAPVPNQKLRSPVNDSVIRLAH